MWRLLMFAAKISNRKLALFGSVWGSEFAPDSDIDVLVDFKEGHVPGLAFFNLQDELTVIFGRQVDLHTPKSLSHYFRDQVIASATVLYE
jgi:predicted nucleotidyltransferase